jgi:transcriptional regulator with XRE-family HTH domain
MDMLMSITGPGSRMRSRSYLSSTVDAVQVLGRQLAAARRSQRRTAEEVAERAGITRVTLRRIERGDPAVAIGLYFEVAMVLSVPLFGAEGNELAQLAAAGERELALLPRRVRAQPIQVDDDF